MKQDKTLGVFEGSNIPPIGALVMASFADVHAPIERVQDAVKSNDLKLEISAPSKKDALALVLREASSTFDALVREDRKRHSDVESLTWDVKLTGRNEYVLHRVVLVKSEKGRLTQPNIARVWIDDSGENEGVRVEVYDDRVFDEREATKMIDSLVRDWMKFVNVQRIRLAFRDLLRDAKAIPWMPRGIGGVSFVPNAGLASVERFGAFMSELEEFKTTTFDFALRYVAVWDTNEVRRSLLRDVEDEVNKRLDALAEKVAQDVLEADDAKRLEKILERRVNIVSESMGIATSYESLLKSKIAIRERLIAPKLLAEASKKMEKGSLGMSERSRALFYSLVGRGERAIVKEAK